MYCDWARKKKKKNKTYSRVFKNTAMDKIQWEAVAGFVNAAKDDL